MLAALDVFLTKYLMETSGANIVSLALQAIQCRTALQKLYQDEHKRVFAGASPNNWASYQVAEFNVWCANIGILDEGTRSIEFRLRDVPELCELITLLLQTLKSDLRGTQCGHC